MQPPCVWMLFTVSLYHPIWPVFGWRPGVVKTDELLEEGTLALRLNVIISLLSLQSHPDVSSHIPGARNRVRVTALLPIISGQAKTSANNTSVDNGVGSRALISASTEPRSRAEAARRALISRFSTSSLSLCLQEAHTLWQPDRLQNIRAQQAATELDRGS